MKRNSPYSLQKVLCFVLLIAILITSRCSKSPEQAATSGVTTQCTEVLGEPRAPVREFGTPASFTEISDGMLIGMLYPKTEYEFLNTAISDWVRETSDFYKNEARIRTDKSHNAELTASYESFMVSDTLASIEIHGEYLPSPSGEPVHIMKTFNVDTAENKVLTIKDVFKNKGLKKFKAMVASATFEDPHVVEKDEMSNFILAKDGIHIIYTEKTLCFPYKDIKKLVNKSYKSLADKKKEKPESTEGDTEVLAENVQQTGGQTRKIVALTFDDGPSAHTDRLLDLFEKFGGKGTFFMVGNLTDRRPDTLKRVCAEGHEIASHSWDHAQLTALDPQGVRDQLNKTRTKIKEITGVDAPLVRPPYGSCDDSVKAVGRELGISFINWSVDTLDWKTRNSGSIYNEILKQSNNGSIILCHDIYGTTVDAMVLAIPKLIADGYELVTVTELLSYGGGSIEPGQVYHELKLQ